MKKQNYYIGLAFIILVFGIWAIPKIVKHLSKPDLAYIEKEGIKAEVPAFSFSDQNGKTITNKDYKGKVYVVEFFFTSCTSICPIMTESMKTVQDKFNANANVGIASFSIDPQFDSPEVLKKYAEERKITKPQWHLLTGNKDEIFKLANAGFNLYVAQMPDKPDGFEHSGYFALVDKEGFIRSRIDENGNPIIYYDGLKDEDVKMLIEDINKLL